MSYRTEHVQKFRPKDFFKAFISSNLVVGIIFGVLLYIVSWKLSSEKELKEYFGSIESTVGWLGIALSTLTSYIFSIGKTINERIGLIQKDLAKIEQEITFDPEKTDILHKFEGLIAITNAEPMEWFTPFYYFYLINNGLVTLKWRNEPICLGKCECIKIPRFLFLDKTIPLLDDYQKERTQILTSLRDGDMDIFNLNKTLRFMFISVDDFQLLQHNIACLYAIHDLFGAHLFVLNKSLLDDLNVKISLSELKANCKYDASGNLFDVAFGINRTPKNLITALYLNKDTQNIEEFPNVSNDPLIKLLKVLANKAEENKLELKPMPENKIKYHLVIGKGK